MLLKYNIEEFKRIYSETPVGVHEPNDTIHARFSLRPNTATTKVSTVSTTIYQHRQKENIDTENTKHDNLG